MRAAARLRQFLSSMTQPPSHSRLNLEVLSTLRQRFAGNLDDFASTSASFKILHTVPSNSPPSSASKILVLDSSFNPPSRAHSTLVTNALKDNPPAPPQRVLLLLATVNADKKPKPADYADRLVMMSLMAEELHSSPSSPVVDIGITSKPYFIDKAKAIDDSGAYGAVVEQTHLTGFDTLLRILAPKYYPPTHNLAVLEPFLTKHRIRATFRPSSSSGNNTPEYDSVDAQQGYLDTIRKGGMEAEGLNREWSRSIELVEGKAAEGVSSTAARAAVKDGSWDDLRRYVGNGVEEWIRERQLYLG